jgi:flagellar protein FliL
MSPEPAAEEQKTEPAKQPPKGKLKLILIAAVLIVLLAGGGATAYFKFFMPHGGDHKAEAAIEPVIQEMEPFLVNLADPGGKRFLKLTMKAKMDGKNTAAEFVSRHFEMRDLILMLLSGKEFADIAKPEDKAGLKQEIMGLLNRNLKKGQLQDLYFTEFLVQ